QLLPSLLLAAALGAVGLVVPAAAQSQDLARPTSDIRLIPGDVATTDALANLWPAGPAPTPEHTGIKAGGETLWDSIIHLPAKENLWWAIAGGAGALAVHPADTDVTESLANASWTDSFFELGEDLGAFPTLAGASIAVYVVGRARGDRKVSHA